jgi:predicted PurR-regulated permease PerM
VYPGVNAFFSLLGRALEAQTVIALVNTSMTAFGLALIGVPNIAMLSVIVFLASYIPVLGMWLSTIPMVVVAMANGGLVVAIQVVAMVCVVHILEAYVINPRIYGAHMQVHPLMTLIILIVGEHIAGLWGLVLGMPIWTYIWRYVILGMHDELWHQAAGGAAAPAETQQMGSAPLAEQSV